MEKQWQGTTWGNSLMHKWLMACLRHCDTRIIYAFAYFFVVPPSIIFRPGARYIYRYFRHQHHLGPWASLVKTYRNHCLFAEAIIDKFAMYAGKKFSLNIHDYPLFQKLASREEGFVILSSHIGNYELAGYSLIAHNKPFNALIYFGEKETVMENRQRMFQHTNIRMIPIKRDMSHLFAIDSALNNGEIVSIPADRIWGSSKNVEVTLLSQPTHLPQGPFAVPSMRGLDVIVIHVIKTPHSLFSSLQRSTSYDVFIQQLEYDKGASRKQQTEQLSSLYANVLDSILLQYPEQWYNYFDLWKQ